MAFSKNKTAKNSPILLMGAIQVLIVMIKDLFSVDSAKASLQAPSL